MAQDINQNERNDWRRRFAMAANNRAWDLSESTARSQDEDAEMLDAAHAARFLWRDIGNESNAAHADLLLGHVHALLGNAALAMRYASAAFAFFSNRPSPPSEIAFAHAALANAAHASGDAELHSLHYRKAAEAAPAIAIPENRKNFETTFRVIPKP
jgi:hypothetical protein